jgi:cyclohexadienyl dehydratase
MFKDNRYIFEEILNGRVDLMITDSVEAFYQSRKHKGKICVTMDMPLTSGEIAALMPRDIIWKEYVDTWLSLINKNGLLKKLMDN